MKASTKEPLNVSFKESLKASTKESLEASTSESLRIPAKSQQMKLLKVSYRSIT